MSPWMWCRHFFHYAACMTNGNELVYDIQGDVVDGEALLLDPCILRLDEETGSVKRLDSCMSSRAGRTMEITLQKAAGQKLGVRVDPNCGLGGCEVIAVTDGLARSWNAEHPYDSVFPGDEITEANGIDRSQDIA